MPQNAGTKIDYSASLGGDALKGEIAACVTTSIDRQLSLALPPFIAILSKKVFHAHIHILGHLSLTLTAL